MKVLVVIRTGGVHLIWKVKRKKQILSNNRLDKYNFTD